MKKSNSALVKTQRSGVKTLTANFEVLRPLLDSKPLVQGDVYIPGIDAVCVSCGARDKYVMIRKHKKNCPYMAFFAAVSALKGMLD